MYPPAAPKLLVKVPISMSTSFESHPQWSITPRPFGPTAPMLYDFGQTDYGTLHASLVSLCLKTLIVAPESLEPRTSEAWFNSSLSIRQFFPTRVGIFKALVANPMPKVTADSTPKNSANSSSNCNWHFNVPNSCLGLHEATP
ncbi:hypothetical protein BpHYR1_042626 [Brachionus plicatilis]|uniref:Uncharacterized protein n=1 Tax=Brachionus plicatilis TaxID=10195 RepID=A0A3M7T7X3_BRAPC|nr:hypothetical protein BpHYR1_042626 [Brachionus plicatilis]